MQARALLLGLVPFVALAAAAACGGGVVTDGAGGSDSTTATTSWTTTTTPSGGTTSTSGGDIDTACQKACEQLAACKSDPSCFDQCTGELPPEPCADEYIAFVDCMVEFFDPNHCGQPPPECMAAEEAVGSCMGGGSSSSSSGGAGCDTGCSGGPNGSCECDAQCDGASYKVACGFDGQGLGCDCFMDGKAAGKCKAAGGDPCDPWNGCCAAFFFGQ